MEIEEAVRAFTEALTPVSECESVSLVDATGRITGGDITAGISVPSFPKSAMDGYAVRSEDIASASKASPVKLKVIGCLYAGDSVPSNLPGDLTGSAIRIMTGAVVPQGFDTVVKQEDTDYGEDTVSIYKASKEYVNYCKVGEDIKEGTKVLDRGSLIGRAQAGVLASIGQEQVEVIRKLRVAIISTGSEVVEVGQDLEEAKIYNNISYMLRASLNSSAFEVTSDTVPDDVDAIADSLKMALRTSDIIITTGGVSVGARDLIPEALGKIGASKLFAGVNVKPGSPTTGAVAEGKPLLCLSGNPYAAVANFDMYMGNIVYALTGCSAFVPVRSRAVLQSEYSKPSNVRRLVRAKAEGGKVTILSKNQQSSILSSYIGANCYIDLPQGSSCKVGDEVDVILIPEALL